MKAPKFTLQNRIENLEEIQNSWMFVLLPFRWQAIINMCINDLKNIKKRLDA